MEAIQTSTETSYREGKVTRILRQQRNTRRASIYIDGEFAFGLSEDVVYEEGVYKGQFLSVEQQQELLYLDQLSRAKAIALSYLSHKSRTEHELRGQLEGCGFDEDIVESALERFRELGYLNDAEYATRFAQERLKLKGYGPNRIRKELEGRGVGSEDIEEGLALLEQSEAPDQAILELAEKRWQRLRSEKDHRRRQKKLYDFLVRRGFDFEQAREAVDHVLEMDR